MITHIFTILLADNDLVILDNFSTGSSENVPAGAEIIEIDIRDTDLLITSTIDLDPVFYEAAIVSVDESIDNPMTIHNLTVRARVQLHGLN
jgi:UDP-glucose 4-epimerase